MARPTNVIFLLALGALTAAALFAAAQEPESLKIRSGIVKSWNDPFLVAEDDLRRIYIELEKAGKDLEIATRVVFRIIREDERFYETTEIDEVLADPNTMDHLVDYVRGELRIVDPEKVRDPWERPYYVTVQFRRNARDTIELSVIHEDKNWALVLADAIEAQIQRTLHEHQTPSWVVIAFVLSLYALGYQLKPFAKKHPISEVVFAGLYNPIFPMVLAGMLFGARELVTRSDLWIKLLGPESGFLWGDAEELLRQRQGLRDNLFWVVLISLPLSIGANLITSYLRRGKAESPKNQSEPKQESEAKA